MPKRFMESRDYAIRAKYNKGGHPDFYPHTISFLASTELNDQIRGLAKSQGLTISRFVMQLAERAIREFYPGVY